MKTSTVITTIFILILLVIIKNSATSIYNLVQNENIVQDLTNKLDEQKKEQAFLNQRLSEVKSDEFVEREAREKLGLTRDNEQSVFITPPSPTPKMENELDVSNVTKWRELFRF